ncbi:MAG TPA: lysine-sensitive aspartokinase 3 [Bryobacteraceae bacterium]|nr:lysine-sensitive aspartokinase 3 [Bryobacteraceae bacterium]
MKFGGTSVESAEAIQRVAGIVRARLDRKPVVVVSAMGKTTNKLLEIAATAVRGEMAEALKLLAALREFHLREASGLDLDAIIGAHFDDLDALVRGLAVMRELTPRATDAISAYGERVSSVIVAAQLRRCGIETAHVDSRSVIITDRRHTQAAPIFEETNRRLRKTLLPLLEHQVVVMGGFIAATEDGVTSTLGRGGSDYTASIVGAGIGAEEIQIWTDVDGMLTADPTIYPAGHRVKVCSFTEAAELAYFGAKVLHPATVLPAIEKNIPVRILNSRRPDSEGTLIVSNPPPSSSPIRSIACKRNITLVNIVSTRMLMAHGFLRRIFEVFDRYETPVDMLATSEVSVSLTIDTTRSLDAIRAELEAFADVSIEENQAIVCLVGENIRRCDNVSARAFAALDGIRPRMVSQGASQLNLSMVVAAQDLRRAVESLHQEFFRTPDPASFE